MAPKVADARQCSLVFSVHGDSQGRVCRSMREAVHLAAAGYRNHKALASELDMSPSALSMATVLGDGEHVRPFPVERLIALEVVTRNLSPLYTHAALLGHEVRPSEGLAVAALRDVQHLLPQIEALAEVLQAMKAVKRT